MPEAVWIGALSRRHPDAEFRILAAPTGGDDCLGLAEVTHDDLPGVLDAMDDREAVVALEVLRRRDDTALVRFETTRPSSLAPVRRSEVPLETPFTLRDGEAAWEITAPRERLSALGEEPDRLGVPFSVERITRRAGAEQPLTDTQLELVRTAVEAGYYDTPRECSLTELAETVGIAKSTCSETLHRAEGKIVERFVEDTG